jgi:uncharacterized OB-fold protein
MTQPVSTPEHRKPLPDVHDPLYEPYWHGTKDEQLVLQVCDACGYVRWPPSPLCPECLADGGTWRPLPLEGTVYSVAVYEHCYHEAFRDDLPYNIAMVELDAGPRVMTNIVGIDNEDITIGMRVVAAFTPVTDEVTLLKFRPLG